MLLWILWIVLAVVAVLVLAGVVLTILGGRTPPGHVASATLRLRQPPEAVWALIDDAAAYPSWATGVNKVERVAGAGGAEAWRQTMGRNTFVLTTTRREPPRLLERTIADARGPFSGSWTYELAPEAGGAATRVTLTERGHITQRLPRAVMKHFVGYHVYLVKHLQAMASKFGESAEVTDRVARLEG